MLVLACEQETPQAFLQSAMPAVRSALGGSYVALVRGERGRWSISAASGSARPLPEGLLADCLDQESMVEKGSWLAVALTPHAASGEVLLAKGAEDSRPIEQTALAEAARFLESALASVRQDHQQRRRVARLEEILKITSRWSQSQTTDELLCEIAEASTRLLAAERASIFLWDKANRTLVGRPALGVGEDELRVRDDSGVVGQVVHTGESRRVDAEEAPGEVDRRVDQQLGFRTRNLLCVPLNSPKGELFGAFEVINKRDGNFNSEDEVALTELADHASIALANTQQYEQLLRVRRQLTDQAAAGVQMIGHCAAIEALRSTVARIADTDLALLILGENGTGKEVVCQSIHYLSQRRDQPLITVNCAALTETLLDSELFGHEKGAFTDAREARPGKFELADGGTLFLDEIGDMSLSGQAKMLRVLEEKVVVRVGGSNPIPTDARVIAATNQNLGKWCERNASAKTCFSV